MALPAACTADSAAAAGAELIRSTKRFRRGPPQTTSNVRRRERHASTSDMGIRRVWRPSSTIWVAVTYNVPPRTPKEARASPSPGSITPHTSPG